MSERKQRTALRTREQMQNRYYSEENLIQLDKRHRIIPHRHDKHHLEYRRHCKTHPSAANEDIDLINGQAGIQRTHNLKRVRMRQRGGGFH